MQDTVKKISADFKNLSLTDALELKALIEQRIASLALKTLGDNTLNTIDDSATLSSADSLAAKASML
jgi:hypothetical protein